MNDIEAVFRKYEGKNLVYVDQSACRVSPWLAQAFVETPDERRVEHVGVTSQVPRVGKGCQTGWRRSPVDVPVQAIRGTLVNAGQLADKASPGAQLDQTDGINGGHGLLPRGKLGKRPFRRATGHGPGWNGFQETRHDYGLASRRTMPRQTARHASELPEARQDLPRSKSAAIRSQRLRSALA